MDSITQVVLGAAVGQVVLGKKAGNRAMLWGGLAGTIPDLDVAANFFMNDVDALAAHRGFSHSLLFPMLFAPLFGWLVYQFYQRKIDRHKAFKTTFSLIGGLFCLVLIGLSIFLVIKSGSTAGVIFAGILDVIAISLLLRIWKYHGHTYSDLGEKISWKDWSWLFFWGIFTHPLLDCFTTYGTQLFQPFSDYRVSFNVISVADPLYTIPFLIFVISASKLVRDSAKRAVLNWIGIGVSSAYMFLALANKINFNRHFENSLKAQNIEYHRYMSTPLIFNNILWEGIAESKEKYYYGVYSIFDSDKRVKIDSIYKNHNLLAPFEGQEDLETLKWFSNGYYHVLKSPEGEISLNDIRFGVIGNLETPPDTTSYVFHFYLHGEGDQFEVEQRRNTDDVDGRFSKLGERMKGN